MTSKAERIKAARSTSCALYHAQVSRDEVWAYLTGDDWDQHRRYTLGISLQVHHIFGRGSEDHEQRTNLIMVSGCSHSWGHDRCPNEFRIACLYAKWLKATWNFLRDLGTVISEPDPAIAAEFDVSTLGRLVGVPLADWLEVQGQNVQGAYREYAEEMVRWLRSTR